MRLSRRLTSFESRLSIRMIVRRSVGSVTSMPPDAVVVVFVQGVEELADCFQLLRRQFGQDFGDEADFAGDEGPAVGGEPFGDCGDVGALADEFRTGGVGGDVIILVAGEELEFVGTGFDGGGFDVDFGVGVMGFDQADVLEDGVVGTGGGELALAEEHADFGGGAVYVVGVDLNDDGDVVGGAALVDDVLNGQLVFADTGARVDGALDGIFGDALFFSFSRAAKRRAFIAGSGPPILAARVISRTSLVLVFPFLSPATRRFA